jgi:hypothetical protein
MMNKARDLILELYKKDHITRKEADILLDAIVNNGCYRGPCTHQYYPDWTYRPYEQPKWTITSNSNSTNVE